MLSGENACGISTTADIYVTMALYSQYSISMRWLKYNQSVKLFHIYITKTRRLSAESPPNMACLLSS